MYGSKTDVLVSWELDEGRRMRLAALELLSVTALLVLLAPQLLTEVAAVLVEIPLPYGNLRHQPAPKGGDHPHQASTLPDKCRLAYVDCS